MAAPYIPTYQPVQGYPPPSNCTSTAPTPTSCAQSSSVSQFAPLCLPNAAGQPGYFQATPVQVAHPAIVYRPAPNTVPITNYPPPNTTANGIFQQPLPAQSSISFYQPVTPYATPAMNQPTTQHPTSHSPFVQLPVAGQPNTVNGILFNPQYMSPASGQASTIASPGTPNTNRPATQQQVSQASYYPGANPQSSTQWAIQAQTHPNMYSGPPCPPQTNTQTKSITSSMKKFLKSSRCKRVALVGGGVLVGAAAMMGLEFGDSMDGAFEGWSGEGEFTSENVFTSGGGEYASGGGEYASGGGDYLSGDGGLAGASQQALASQMDDVAFSSQAHAIGMNST